VSLRALQKTIAGRFLWRRSQLVSAQRADIEARSRRSTHQQGHALPLSRYLSPDGAASAVTGRVSAEEPCPTGQPLVKSTHADLAATAANVAAVAKKRPVIRSEKF